MCFGTGYGSRAAGSPHTARLSLCHFAWRKSRWEGKLRSKFSNFVACVTVVSSLVLLKTPNDQASAAGLQLTWADNSTDETGFNIERKLGTNGVFSLLATTAPNVTSYSDSGLMDSTTYCYRVNAFNGAGPSAYTPEVCGTTLAPPVTTYNLTVSGQGSGTVTSSPAGINCGATCTASFSGGTGLSLQAVPATGYTFAGWSGDADCLDGSVTMNANKSCTATFTANPVVPTIYTLSVSAVGTITAAGTGSGKVVSSPTGIDCGTKCSANFSSGSIIALQAIPATGSTFVGWSGDADCLDGSVTMNGSKSCSASFQIISYGLTVSLSGTGAGKVTSSVGGINCGTSCSALYAQGAVVTLTPAPAVGSAFSGWSGDADCADGSVTMNSAKSCAAVFTSLVVSNIGIYRPSTGGWYLIANATGLWKDCTVDRCGGPFGADTDLPLVGDWNGSGKSNLGVYDPFHKDWELDLNGNANWDGCKIDRCYNFAIAPKSTDDEIPLIGSWDGAAKDSIGVFKLVSNTTGARNKSTTVNGYFYLDRNRNGKWDGCGTDICFGPFGTSGDIPVVGDWDGSGVSKIGVFTPKTGMWTLDSNGNGKFDGCDVDKCVGPFGSAGDIPVVGDWNGTGTDKIGVFRPAAGNATAEWFLDLNGNGQWDGCNVDKCVTGFGQTGDLPVVGKW